MKEEIKEKKKRCPLCKKEYPEKDNYCRSDGTRLEITNAEPGTPARSGQEEGYAVDDFYLPKPT